MSTRFWSKVEKTETCWLWTATRSQGYGRFHLMVDGRRRTMKAHRVAYEMVVGPVPAGLELDHLCRNPSCVNPAHLEPVTHAENLRRGDYATRPACPHGHPYTPENTYVTKAGFRQCRTCKRIRDRKHP